MRPLNNTFLPLTPSNTSVQHQHYAQLLSGFQSISLDELLRVELLSRSDTKYCINARLLPALLRHLQADYQLLAIDQTRLMPYETLYFDTPNLQCYFDHHNGRSVRYKMRIRRYASTDTIFMEAKLKNAKKQTTKVRVMLPYLCHNLSEQPDAYQQLHLPYQHQQLEPTLWVMYDRLTLSHPHMSERITIDLNLCFKPYQLPSQYQWDELVIIEIKQPHATRQSPVIDFLKAHRLSPSGISKYCMGMHFVNPMLKYNNFKPKLIHIQKNTSTYHGF